MRTPNTACIICAKPLYRRPSDMRVARYAACFEHRGHAQSSNGVTESQKAALELGRVKGDNRRKGYRHSLSARTKIAETNKRFWEENPQLVAARGKKISGESHYRWKGGASALNVSIRQMTENRKWMDAVKQRDKCCMKCGSIYLLEAHHIVELSALIETLNIKTREDAIKHKAEIFNTANGLTLCRKCHYSEHGRIYHEN